MIPAIVIVYKAGGTNIELGYHTIFAAITIKSQTLVGVSNYEIKFFLKADCAASKQSQINLEFPPKKGLIQSPQKQNCFNCRVTS